MIVVNRKTPSGRSVALGLCLLLGALALPSAAQETADAPETAISPAEAEAYLGTWTLSADFQGNAVEMTLEIVVLDEVVAAALSSPLSPEPQLMDRITHSEEGLDLSWEADFGGPQGIRIHVKGSLQGDKFVGSFADEGGFFTADFSGDRAAEAADIVSATVERVAEQEGKPQRRARFGGTVETSLAFGDNKVRVTFGTLDVDSVDHERFLAVETDEVFTYPGNRCFKLLIDADLHFGETTVPAHNFGDTYPGAYCLWLKKTADGWHLVFNEMPDVWGTMHDPAKDVAEVPLEVEELAEAADELEIEILEAEEGGVLRIAWGTQAYSARFLLGAAPP